MFVKTIIFAAILIPVFILAYSGYAKVYDDPSLANLFYSLTLLLNSLLGYLILRFLSRLKNSEERLRETSLKLSQANATLEERVAQRTNQLALINRALEEEKIKDESILVAIGDGLIVTDKKGYITFVNKAFEKLLGWEAREVVGRKMAEIIPREDEHGNRIPPEERMSHLVLTGKRATTSAETYFIRRNSDRLPIALTVAPIIFNRTISGAVEVFHDMSAEKEIDRAKTEFVSLASHQLRTPLSTVKWHTELLLDGDIGKVPPKQKKFIKEIYHANERMIDLVNALLNVSRIELGTITISPELLRIADVAHEVIAEFLPEIKERRLSFKEQIDPSLPELSADRQILTIIFQNLLSNAIKYTPAGGEIAFTIEAQLDHALIAVKDTGYGIPRGQQPKIFSKLFRADNAREMETDGNGLGLYIVKYVVTEVGGKIWFESEENKGSTFYVALPFSGMKRRDGGKRLIA